MPLYESTFIARPDISSQQVDGLAEQFREILTEAGGEIAKTEYWGLRSLAYRIKKNRKGHYYFMNIDAPPEAISAMEHTMRINEDVIRYLTVRVDEHDPNPAPLTQSRGRGRDGRGGRGGRWEGRRRDDDGEGRRREGDGERGERSERPAREDAAPAADASAKETASETPPSESPVSETPVSEAPSSGESAAESGAREKSDG